jgi:hypothetical protein
MHCIVGLCLVGPLRHSLQRPQLAPGARAVYFGRSASQRGDTGAVVIGDQLKRKRLASKTEFNGIGGLRNPHQNCADMRHSSL